MKDKILKQIEKEALKYAEHKSSSSVFHDAHVKDFTEGAKFGYNIKESVDEKLLRQVQRLTTWLRMEGNDDDIKMILEAEEVMNEAESILSASQNTVINKGEKWVSVEDRLPDENTPVLLKFIRLVGMFDDELIRIGKYRISEVGNTFLTEDMRRHSISETTHWMPLPNPPKEK